MPPTLLTDDAERARRFICDQGPAVCKPAVQRRLHRPGRRQCLTVWVEEVAVAELDAGVGHAMHLFQSRVDKAVDVRLTAVGTGWSPCEVGILAFLDHSPWRHQRGLGGSLTRHLR
ncbi:hypothetical protein [Streptomyces sp. TE5632]